MKGEFLMLSRRFMWKLPRIKPFFLKVYAEGNDSNNTNDQDKKTTQDQKPNQDPRPNQDPKPMGTVNFEELIAKARQEEKDKLYPEIQSWKEKHNNLLLVIAERDAKIKELEGEITKFKKQIEEVKEKSSKTNDATVSELKATIDSLNNQIEQLKSSHDKEIARLNLEIFKREKLAEVGEEIIPELVTGETEEEILASIEKAKEKYQQIVSKINKGITYPPINPNVTKIDMKNKSVEEIVNMPAGEWAEFRKQLGFK